MAKKDVDEYYAQVCHDYSEMLSTLTDMEEAFNENLVSEAQLNQVKSMIEPLKRNYMTLSWVIYLLNKPTRKEKTDRYNRQMKKFLKDKDLLRDKEHILQENQSVISDLKSMKFK